MSVTTAIPTLPAVPVDVLDFAAAHNLVLYLRPILALTRDIFPVQTLAVRLDDDPDVPDYQTIGVQVDVTGWTAEDMLQARSRWIEQVLQVCPASEVWHFRIGMVQTA